MTRNRILSTLVAGGLVATLIGCGVATGPIDSDNLGITSGGVQDIAAARARISSGYVPDPNTITVEGFFSEHDIPLTPPADAPELYASYGLAWRSGFDMPAPGADVFVRLGTTVDLADYSRRPQNLVLAIDRSGSMSDTASASDNRSKLESVKQALHSLLGRLNGNDLVTLVSFNQFVNVPLGATAGDNTNRIGDAIDRLNAFGNTDLYEALRVSFERAAASADDAHDSRVILFTDALPTVGEENKDAFVNLVRAYAEQGVGLTIMGVGYSYGNSLFSAMASQRLANAFYLSNQERISSIFEDEFEYFVSPAVFDLNLQINIPDGVGIRDVYGVPDYVPGSNGAQVTIPTLFFSAREGGGVIIVRLTFAETPTFDEDVTIGTVGMEYTLRNGEQRTLGTDLVLPAGIDPSGEPPYYSDDAVKRAAVLLDAALVLREASQAAWQSRNDEGVAMIEEFLTWFDEATLGMSDRTDATSRGLSDERNLLEALKGAISSYRYWYYYY